MYVQPLDGPLGPGTLSPFGGAGESGGAGQQGFSPGTLAGDNIARFMPPWLTGSTQNPGAASAANSLLAGGPMSLFGPLSSMLQQLMQMLQMMMGTGSQYGGSQYGGSQYGGSQCPPYGNEQYYQNASGGSNGDPHLSFNGNTWNSMVSQPNLLNSDSFPGGFQISTQVTPTNSHGVSWNQSATVAMNGGATTVSLDNNGQPNITEYGQNVPISAGQTVQLGNGDSVACGQNGALTVVANNGSGGQITTTLTAQGAGVNVGVNAQNVDLGGTLANEGSEGSPQPPYGPPIDPLPPITGPIGGPIFNPNPPTTGPIGGPVFGPNPPIFNPITGPITGPIRMPHPPIIMHPF